MQKSIDITYTFSSLLVWSAGNFAYCGMPLFVAALYLGRAFLRLMFGIHRSPVSLSPLPSYQSITSSLLGWNIAHQLSSPHVVLFFNWPYKTLLISKA